MPDARLQKTRDAYDYPRRVVRDEADDRFDLRLWDDPRLPDTSVYHIVTDPVTGHTSRVYDADASDAKARRALSIMLGIAPHAD